MPAAKSLTPRHARFVAEYVANGGNGTQAAIAAGYSPTSAKFRASEMLTLPHVKAEMARLRGKVMDKLEVTVERVLKERARLAFFDPRKMFDADGKLLPIHELDEDSAAVIAGMEVEETLIGTGDKREVVSRTRKVKLSDKTASLTALEKHLGMYRDEGGGDGALSIHIHL